MRVLVEKRTKYPYLSPRIAYPEYDKEGNLIRCVLKVKGLSIEGFELIARKGVIDAEELSNIIEACQILQNEIVREGKLHD